MEWSDYYHNRRESEPSSGLLRALSLWQEDAKASTVLQAVDIGCGTGPDTKCLLESGFSVFALDPSAEAHGELLLTVPEQFQSAWKFVCSSFEDWEPTPAGFVHAKNSLFFCSEEGFRRAWARLVAVMPEGAYFCGTFMGPKDEWAERLLALSREEVKGLFQEFTILEFEDFRANSPTAMGVEKYWHLFEVIARKK